MDSERNGRTNTFRKDPTNAWMIRNCRKTLGFLLRIWLGHLLFCLLVTPYHFWFLLEKLLFANVLRIVDFETLQFWKKFYELTRCFSLEIVSHRNTSSKSPDEDHLWYFIRIFRKKCNCRYIHQRLDLHTCRAYREKQCTDCIFKFFFVAFWHS